MNLLFFFIFAAVGGFAFILSLAFMFIGMFSVSVWAVSVAALLAAWCIWQKSIL